jgi:sec-independent protein translocase protein TatA
MGSFSLWHWIIVLVIVVVLFGGRGKISELMGDLAKGIKTFKKGMGEDEAKAAADPQTIDHDPAANVVSDRADQKTKIS